MAVSRENGVRENSLVPLCFSVGYRKRQKTFVRLRATRSPVFSYLRFPRRIKTYGVTRLLTGKRDTRMLASAVMNNI